MSRELDLIVLDERLSLTGESVEACVRALEACPDYMDAVLLGLRLLWRGHEPG